MSVSFAASMDGFPLVAFCCASVIATNWNSRSAAFNVMLSVGSRTSISIAAVPVKQRFRRGGRNGEGVMRRPRRRWQLRRDGR